MSKILNDNVRLQAGDIEIISLTDAIVTLPAQEMFPSVSGSEWTGYHDMYPNAFKGLDTWTARISCNLIRTPDRLILVDTGVGPSSTAFAQFLRTDGELPQQMEKEGIAMTDIDIVFLKHLHADHVGWNISAEDQHPIFPNAVYLASKADWDMCRYRLENEPQRAAYIRENVIPLKEQQHLQFIDEEITLTNGVKAFYTPGHTPGHMSIKVEVGDEQKIWLLGDALAHPLQITKPTHSYIFDRDPRKAIETRIHLLDEIERQGGILGGCHFPQPGYGSLINKQGKRYWQSI